MLQILPLCYLHAFGCCTPLLYVCPTCPWHCIPQYGMQFTMRHLMECIRDCSMLYVLQSAHFSHVYYPNAWYVVYNDRLNGMHQGLFHAICITKWSILTYICYRNLHGLVVFSFHQLVQIRVPKMVLTLCNLKWWCFPSINWCKYVCPTWPWHCATWSGGVFLPSTGANTQLALMVVISCWNLRW